MKHRLQHLHGVGVAKRMKRHRHIERRTVGSCRFYRFIQLGRSCPIVDRPDVCLVRSAGALIPTHQRYFRRGHHHLQLADVLKIGQRDDPVKLTPSLPFPDS